jgi:aryl-alcohol dehydrogenase-like predicted oxidoreductase
MIWVDDRLLRPTIGTMSQLIPLGRTGLHVSRICFGTWQLSPKFWGDVPPEQVTRAVHRAVELGVNFFDTADVYGDGFSETVLGQALKPFKRDEVIVATKAYWVSGRYDSRAGDLSKPHLLSACEASLKRLGMEYIDLYQCHSFDPLADFSEIIDGMETLVRQGKIRCYGTSNWSVEQIRAGRALGGKFDTVQPFYSLLKYSIESDLLPYCRANDLGVLVYSPLHRGLLTGKYRGDETFDDVRASSPEFQGESFKKTSRAVAKIGEMAQAMGMTTVQFVLAATLTHPAIHSAIVGIKRPGDIEEAVSAIGHTVSRQDFYAARALLAG